jgi:hypothetical protein
MDARQTIEHIQKKYNLDLNQESPIMIPIGRFKDMPRLFRELGFKVGAEIGVFQGDYSRWLLRGIPGLKLFGIDAWSVYGDYKDYKSSTMNVAQAKAIENTKGYNCVLIKGWSDDKEILDKFADNSLDFIFIDGNHAYEYVVRDIALWSKKVRKGGIIYGHDFDDYSNYTNRWKDMHVIDAVTGWTKSYRIKPWFVITNNKNKCWFYIKE